MSIRFQHAHTARVLLKFAFQTSDPLSKVEEKFGKQNFRVLRDAKFQKNYCIWTLKIKNFIEKLKIGRRNETRAVPNFEISIFQNFVIITQNGKIQSKLSSKIRI